MPPRVNQLDIDEYNEDEAARHGVSAREMRQVKNNEPEFFPNTKGHLATIIMIGPTYGGRFLTIPLAPTAVPGVWRPATAWSSSEREAKLYHDAHHANR